MPSHRGQSNKIARQKARRAELKKRQARAEAARAPHALLRRASEFPIDKAYLSQEWRDDDPDQASLVAAILTRRRGATILVGVALIDRTCLGIKNAFARVVSEAELAALLQQIGELHDGLEEVDLLTWHSVVFNALDYARSLGFEPHPDLPLSFLGTRPEPLLDTPLARPERPLYIAGPDDDQGAIVARLMKARGTDYRAVLAGDRERLLMLDPARGRILEPMGDDEDLGEDDAIDDEDERGG